MAQPRNDLQKGCNGKIGYDTFDRAVNASLALHERKGGQAAKAYFCSVCGSFHIGRKGGAHHKPPITKEGFEMLLEKNGNAPVVQESVRQIAAANRELSWLAQRVAKGKKEAFAEICTITPSIARHMLEYNDGNRKVRETLVRQIASDISNGLWQLNGEAIVISNAGELNDGQHRLSAVIEAGKSIQTLVMFGVNRASRFTVDMGAARTAKDFLGMDGVSYPNETAAAAKLLLLYSRGIYSTKTVNGLQVRCTKAEVVEYFDTHASVITAAIQEFAHDKFARMVSVGVVTAAYVILMKANDAQAGVFFHRFITGENLKKNDPILVLRMHMMTCREERLPAYAKLELILRYWNAWREGKPLSRRITLRGAYPELKD